MPYEEICGRAGDRTPLPHVEAQGKPASKPSYSETSNGETSAKRRALGLRASWKTRRKYVHTAETDQAVRDAYEHWLRDNDRQAIKRTAQRLGWPKFVLTRRAAELGLARTKEPPWAAEEELLLEEFAYLSPHVIRRKFAARGYKRTATAIILKRKRLHVKRELDGSSVYGFSQLLGIDSHAVSRWIQKGMLRVKACGTARKPSQGGDSYWIPREEARKFILTYPDEIDLRKVNKYWFIWAAHRRDGGVMTSKPVKSMWSPPPLRQAKPEAADELPMRGNQIQLFGSMFRDAKTLTDKLRELPFSINLHGDLRVLLSTSRRFVQTVETLLETEEGGNS